MKPIFIALSMFFLGQLQAQEFLPEPVQNHQVVHYDQFTLCYNEEHEQPDWVYYKLTKEELSINIARSDHFDSDDSIHSGSAQEEDFRNSGFDRGHLCPAANCEYDSTAYIESFLLSNMSPQIPAFNSGIWKTLEEWERKQANKFDSIYVVTGPVFVNELGTLGNNEVTIPGYFFKCALRFKEGKPKTIGFLIPHVGATGKIDDYIVPVNTIETISGLDIFRGLGSTENRVEATAGKSNWKF